MNQQISEMLIRVGLPVKPCGLNADWCVSAWHLSTGESNVNSGDRYLVDTEITDVNDNELFDIVQRFYGENDDRVQTILRRMTLEQIEASLRTITAENDLI